MGNRNTLPPATGSGTGLYGRGPSRLFVDRSEDDATKAVVYGYLSSGKYLEGNLFDLLAIVEQVEVYLWAIDPCGVLDRHRHHQ